MVVWAGSDYLNNGRTWGHIWLFCAVICTLFSSSNSLEIFNLQEMLQYYLSVLKMLSNVQTTTCFLLTYLIFSVADRHPVLVSLLVPVRIWTQPLYTDAFVVLVVSLAKVVKHQCGVCLSVCSMHQQAAVTQQTSQPYHTAFRPV